MRDTIVLEQIIAMVYMYLDDVAEKPHRLPRAKELAAKQLRQLFEDAEKGGA